MMCNFIFSNSFKPDDAISQIEAIIAMNNDLRIWLITDRLTIYDDKTELLLIGRCPCFRYLGAWFDNKLSMSRHATQICNAAFYHLHNIRRIKKYLSHSSLKH